jgi:hypothetical protein
MKDFPNLKSVLSEFSGMDYENDPSFISIDPTYEYVLSARKELIHKGYTLYGSEIKRITLLPHDTINRLTTVHLYVEPMKSMLGKIIDEIGMYNVTGDWGIEPSIEPKVYGWNKQEFQVDLRKNKKMYTNFPDSKFMYVADIISISPVYL